MRTERWERLFGKAALWTAACLLIALLTALLPEPGAAGEGPSPDYCSAEGIFGFPTTGSTYLNARYPAYPGGKKHTGIDIKCGMRTQVYAIFPGELQYFRVWQEMSDGRKHCWSYGNCAVIVSDEKNEKGYPKYMMLVGHMSEFADPSLYPIDESLIVSDGDGGRSKSASTQVTKIGDKHHVLEGEYIGLSGGNGNSTGPHLHVEIHVCEYGANFKEPSPFNMGGTVNPEDYISSSYTARSRYHLPVGKLESITGFHDPQMGRSAVLLQGWAYDPDDQDSSLAIRVELTQNGSTETKTIVCNEERSGLTGGVSGRHGFDYLFYSSLSGKVDVKVYAVNVGEGNDLLLHEGRLDLSKASLVINGAPIGYAQGDYFTNSGEPCTNRHLDCKHWAGAQRSAAFALWCQDRMFSANEVDHPERFLRLDVDPGYTTAQVLTDKFFFLREAGLHIHTRNGKSLIVCAATYNERTMLLTDVVVTAADIQESCRVGVWGLTIGELVDFVNGLGGVDYMMAYYTQSAADLYEQMSQGETVAVQGEAYKPYLTPNEVELASGSPFGQAERMEYLEDDYVHIRGWAVDPDAPSAPVEITVYGGGLEQGVFRTDIRRDDLLYGGLHGFEFTFRPTVLGDCQVHIFAADDSGADPETLLYMGSVNVVRPVLVIYDGTESDDTFAEEEDPYGPPTVVTPMELRYVVWIDEPTGTYTKGEDGVISGWIASTQPILAVMAEGGGCQYNLTSSLTDASAELDAAGYGEYIYKERFYGTFPTGGLVGNQSYLFRIWAHFGNNGVSQTCTRQCYIASPLPEELQVHAWISDEPMGDIPEEYIAGRTYYLCYELLDSETGVRVDETYEDLVYSAKMELWNGSYNRRLYSCQDADSLGISANEWGTYTGRVTIESLDYETFSAEVSFDVAPNTYLEVRHSIGQSGLEGQYGLDAEHDGELLQGVKTEFSSYLVDGNTGISASVIGGRNEFTQRLWIEATDGTIVAEETEQSDWHALQATLTEPGDYFFCCQITGYVMGRYTDRTYSYVMRCVENPPRLDADAEALAVYQGDTAKLTVAAAGYWPGPVSISYSVEGGDVLTVSELAQSDGSVRYEIGGKKPGSGAIALTLQDTGTGAVLATRRIPVAVDATVIPSIRLWVSRTELGDAVDSAKLLQGGTYFLNYALIDRFTGRPFDEVEEECSYRVRVYAAGVDEDKDIVAWSGAMENAARGSMALPTERLATFYFSVSANGTFDGREYGTAAICFPSVVPDPPRFADGVGGAVSLQAPGSVTRALAYAGYPADRALRYHVALDANDETVEAALSDPYAAACALTVTGLNEGRETVRVFLLDAGTDEVLDERTFFVTVTAREYTLSFDMNGGSGEIAPVVKKHHQPVRLPADEPVRVGYLFRGWADDPDASSPSWSAGGTCAVNGNAVLYAVWDRGEPVEYLRWKEYGDGVVVTGYRALPDTLAIPEEIDGLPVVGIGAYAFRGCATLTAVTIPESALRVGYGAFSGCAALRSVALPAGLTAIDAYTFSGCAALEGIALPQGITSVGAYAFANCSSLTGIALPEGLTALANGAFMRCTALETASLPGTLTTIAGDAFYQCAALRALDLPAGLAGLGTRALYGCAALEEISIPGGVVEIGEGALAGCAGLQRLTLAEGVRRVGGSAFARCSAPEELLLPGSLVNIGEGAFSYCPGIARVSAPAGSYAVQWAQANLPDAAVVLTEGSGGAFVYETDENGAVTGVTVPAGTVSLPDYAFSEYTALQRVDLPEGLLSIGAHAFEQCFALEEIILPSTVTSIGEQAFYNCRALRTVRLPAALESIGQEAFGYCARVADYAFPAGLVSIGARAFIGNDALAEISLPEGLTALGNQAFAYCSALRTGSLPDSLNGTGYGVFEYCSALREARLGGGLAEIAQRMFNECPALERAQLPAGITAVGEAAFRSCASPTGVNLPAGLRTIGESAFQGCASLTRVLIPEGVTEIWAHAFQNCASLESLQIPASVTSFERTALLSGAGTALKGTDKLQTIYTPAGSAAAQWIAAQYAGRGFTLSEPVLAQRVDLSATMTSLSWHEEAQLTAAIAPAGVTGQGLVWSSSFPEAVSVDQTGHITAHYPSVHVDLTATTLDGSASATCTVVVWKETAGLVYELGGGALETNKRNVIIGPEKTFGSLPVPEKEGCLFLGWYDGPDDTATRVTAETPTGVPEEGTLTLWAHWREAGVPALAGRSLGDGSVLLFWEDASAPDQYALYEEMEGERILRQLGVGREALLTPDAAGPRTYVVAGLYATADGEAERLSEPVTVDVRERRMRVYLTSRGYDTWRLPEDFRAMADEAGAACVSSDRSIVATSRGLVWGNAPGTAAVTLPYRGRTASCTVEVVPLYGALALPNTLREIGEEAFAHDTSLEVVYIPDRVTRIGSRAFYCCTELKVVWIPASVREIDARAFDGCPQLRIYCAGDSAAARYAESNAIPFYAD